MKIKILFAFCVFSLSSMGLKASETLPDDAVCSFLRIRLKQEILADANHEVTWKKLSDKRETLSLVCVQWNRITNANLKLFVGNKFCDGSFAFSTSLTERFQGGPTELLSSINGPWLTYINVEFDYVGSNWPKPTEEQVCSLSKLEGLIIAPQAFIDDCQSPPKLQMLCYKTALKNKFPLISQNTIDDLTPSEFEFLYVMDNRNHCCGVENWDVTEFATISTPLKDIAQAKREIVLSCIMKFFKFGLTYEHCIRVISVFGREEIDFLKAIVQYAPEPKYIKKMEEKQYVGVVTGLIGSSPDIEKFKMILQYVQEWIKPGMDQTLSWCITSTLKGIDQNMINTLTKSSASKIKVGMSINDCVGTIQSEYKQLKNACLIVDDQAKL